MNIAGVATVVTGGASGLGAATAVKLASAGAKVAVFDRDRAQGERIARQAGGMFVNVDVTDEQSVVAGLDQVCAEHVVPRILVNCAAICPAATTVHRDNQPNPIGLFRQAVEVNLIGTFCTAHVDRWHGSPGSMRLTESAESSSIRLPSPRLTVRSGRPHTARPKGDWWG